MNEVTDVLGHAPREVRRLELQAEILRPLTGQLLQDCGLGPGQSVLDIGTGAGDVALLAAEIVGDSGAVVGIDRSDAVLERARARAEAAGLSQIRFEQADLEQVETMGSFDLVIFRYVLIHQADHAGFLRTAASLVKKGGCLAMIEMAARVGDYYSHPPLPMYDDQMARIFAAFSRAGANLSIGLSLIDVFAEASLPEPQLMSSVPVGGPTSSIPEWIVRTLSAVSTPPTVSDDDIALSADGMRRAAICSRSQLFGPRNVAAWTRLD